MPFHVKRDPPASGPLLGPDDAMRQRRSATRHLQVTALPRPRQSDARSAPTNLAGRERPSPPRRGAQPFTADAARTASGRADAAVTVRLPTLLTIGGRMPNTVVRDAQAVAERTGGHSLRAPAVGHAAPHRARLVRHPTRPPTADGTTSCVRTERRARSSPSQAVALPPHTIACPRRYAQPPAAYRSLRLTATGVDHRRREAPAGRGPRADRVRGQRVREAPFHVKHPTHPWGATQQHGPSYARRSATSPRFQDGPRLRHSQLAPPQRPESASRRAAPVPRVRARSCGDIPHGRTSLHGVGR